MMIESLLPHSKDMVLVDEVLFVDKCSVQTKSVIKDSPFIKDGKFMSYSLIEIMAQTLGLYKSHIYKKSGANIAFLIGSRKFEVFLNHLKIGDEIHTKAVLSLQDESGFGVYDCEVFLGFTLIARAKISVFNPSKEKFLELKNG
ncbi:thioester dehydrase [Campylobacter hyointestinalis subsp. hyointestinalis]|nr:thioester dehydrase [Campylobacter hyointestinalis subsp. hyointestinalis]